MSSSVRSPGIAEAVIAAPFRVTWTPEIWGLWHTYVEAADPKLFERRGRPWRANFFTPRPYVDELCRRPSGLHG